MADKHSSEEAFFASEERTQRTQPAFAEPPRDDGLPHEPVTGRPEPRVEVQADLAPQLHVAEPEAPLSALHHEPMAEAASEPAPVSEPAPEPIPEPSPELEPDPEPQPQPHSQPASQPPPADALAPLSIAPDEPVRAPASAQNMDMPQPAAASLGAVEPRSDEGTLWERWKPRVLKGLRYALIGFAAYLAFVLLVLIPIFRFVDPPGSALMLRRLVTGTAIDRRWVDLDQISPRLVRAVIVSEDGRFCEHPGIDLIAMEQAIRSSGDGAPRGASTISMQVIKNLYLWPDKSYIRKVIELPLTLAMEVMWPKWRVAEVYLNIAEWGPGIFGAEAAAQHHFHKSAARLTEQEAALLAASLPNPMIRDASDPGPQTARKARVIQARVRAYGNVAQCVTSVQNASQEEAQPKARERRPFKRPERQRPRREEAPGLGGWTTEIR